MKIQKINNSAAVYTYDELESCSTNVFLIERESKIYIIDTYCGSNSMIPILNAIENIPEYKELIVINTHFHWDHVWGNCSFKGSKIISHELCRELLDRHWETQINKNKAYISGIAEKTLPNLTFKERMFFQSDGIELFYSPGHTADSISIFDHSEKILYAGDNLEKPLIYVENAEISTYIRTLENYMNYHPRKVMAGHTLDLTEADIIDTIEYLKALSDGKEMYFEEVYKNQIHKQNLKMRN